jgi:hypothetical protein
MAKRVCALLVFSLCTAGVFTTYLSHTSEEKLGNLKYSQYTGRQKQLLFSLVFKVHGELYSFDIVESVYNNQIAISPSSAKEKRLNFKNMCSNKKVLQCLLIAIYIVSLYGT